MTRTSARRPSPTTSKWRRVSSAELPIKDWICSSHRAGISSGSSRSMPSVFSAVGLMSIRSRWPYPVGYRSGAVEEPFGHRVDLGDTGAGERIDARLHLRHGAEGLGGQALGKG